MRDALGPSKSFSCRSHAYTEQDISDSHAEVSSAFCGPVEGCRGSDETRL